MTSDFRAFWQMPESNLAERVTHMVKTLSSQPKVSALLTRNIFLDTQVFRQLGHNPDNAVLKTLAGHIRDNGLVLHLTDITLLEIRRQLHEFTSKTAQALKIAKKEYGRWRHRLPKFVPNDLPTFESTVVADAAYDALFRTAKIEWEAKLHAATAISALDIFNDYFEGKAPFSAHASKEFPDAFVVKCLEKWCSDNSEKMYVVTADKAMADAVIDAPNLYHVHKIEEIFSSIAATETPDIRDIVEVLLNKKRVIASIQSQIDENIDDLIPIYDGDYPDGEVSDHELNGDIQIVDFKVISVSNEDAGLLLDVKTPLSVQIDYEDRSDAVYDKEDDVYFGAETATTHFEDDPDIRVYARLNLKSAKLTALNILTNEVNVSEPADEYY